MLRVVNVSKAQSCQRAGRAGREGPGICYRLFRETEYDKLLEMTPPEILRLILRQPKISLQKIHVFF